MCGFEAQNRGLEYNYKLGIHHPIDFFKKTTRLDLIKNKERRRKEEKEKKGPVVGMGLDCLIHRKIVIMVKEGKTGRVVGVEISEVMRGTQIM